MTDLSPKHQDQAKRSEESDSLAHRKVRSDFVFIRQIGEGSFSSVYLVEDKKSGNKFASNKI